MENSFEGLKAEIRQSVGSPEDDHDDSYSLFASPFGHLNKPQSRKTLYLLISLLNVAFPDYDFSEAKPDHFCKERSGSNVLQALSTTFNSVRPLPSQSNGPHLIYAPRSYSAYPPVSSSNNGPDGDGGSSPEFYSSSLPKSLPKRPMPWSSRLGGGTASSTSSSPILTAASAANLGQPQSLPANLDAKLLATPPQPLSAGVNPSLFQILDKVIELEHCDVYSYSPDVDSDPHADDGDESDDYEDELGEGSGDEEAGGLDEDDFRHDRRWNSRNGIVNLDDNEAALDDFSPKHAGFPSTSPFTTSAPFPMRRNRHRRDGHPSTVWEDDDDDEDWAVDARQQSTNGGGGLLWSSHWFFHNRKLKRILFITIWAKKRRSSPATSRVLGYAGDMLEDFSVSEATDSGGQFIGWDGAAGAGARALKVV